MPTNDAAAPAQVWPGIRIHAIDIVQPPGIAIPAVPGMDEHQATVVAALAANSSAATTLNERSDSGSDAARSNVVEHCSWRMGSTTAQGLPYSS
jgi:hypothetical protein